MRSVMSLLLVLIFFTVNIARADWLDDWFTQYSASGPNYYESQKRGFLTFGTFSGRTGLGSSTPLFTIEMPRIRGGCGGIDLFLGGFSFVNPEYLVQKLQNLIQAAPVVAFNLALKILSASLADEVKWVENIINLLNQLQFDECKFLQPFMIQEVKGSTLSERLEYTKNKIMEGVENLFYSAKKKVEEKVFDLNTKRELVDESCPSVVRDIFSRGSLVEWVGVRMGIPSDLIDAIRAFTGDVVVSQTANTPTFVYIKPIVTEEHIKGYLERYKLVRMDKYGNRIEGDINFLNRIQSVLDSAYQAKVNRSPVSSEYVKYVRVSPIPIETVLNIAYLTRKQDFYSGMTPVIALGIYKELLYSILSQARFLLSRIPDLSAESSNCQSMIASLKDGLEQMDENLISYHTIIDNIYTQKLNEVSQTLNVSFRMLTYYLQLRKEISEKLGIDVATRVFGG